MIFLGIIKSGQMSTKLRAGQVRFFIVSLQSALHQVTAVVER